MCRKRAFYVHHHTPFRRDSRGGGHCCPYSWTQYSRLAAHFTCIRCGRLLAGCRAFRIAAARTLLRDLALCLGKSDRPDPALLDHWILSRWPHSRPLSKTRGTLYLDNYRSVFDQPDPFTLKTYS